MTPQERQKALDEISAEDLAKIKAHQAKTEGYPVDNEWLLLTEFAMTFGWQAYLSAKNDEITTMEMGTLIEASRKIKAAQLYQDAYAVLIGSGSAQAKKPSQVFTRLTADIIKQTKVTE